MLTITTHWQRLCWLALFCVGAVQVAGPQSQSSEYIYALPFKGTHKVTQSWGGKTHQGKAHYAVDFGMPRHTPVHAARGGVVEKVEEDYEELTPAEKRARGSKPNSIAIRHDDGTKAVYLHLEEDGVVVKEGETVTAGQHLGYSGNTGKSSGPHLHFAVFAARQPGDPARSIPVKFKTKENAAATPVRGQRYTHP
jgi:murein DD-endopeptidase MepM/ murein hydrolase activator NlpD